MNNKNLFLKGITSNYLHFFIITLVGLWLTPFVLGYLTKEEFGVFAIFVDIIAWVKLIELTNGVLQSKLAQYYGANDSKSANELIISAFIAQSFVAIIVLLFCAFLSFNLDLVFANPLSVAHLKEAFILVAIASSIDLIFQTNSSIISALKMFYLDNLINTVVFLLRVALIVVFLANGLDIMALAIANLIASLVLGALKYHRLKQLELNISWSLSYFSYEKLLFMFHNGKWFTLGALAGLMIFNIDRILTGKYLGLELVTVYIITLKLFDYTDKFLSRIVGMLRPYLAELYAKEDYLKLRELYVFVDQSYSLILIAIGFFVMLINSAFIHWWIGEGFYGGDVLTYFIFLNFSLQAMVMPKRALLASTLFEVKKQNLARLYEGVMNLALSLLLIHHFGLVGLVAASVIATILGSNVTYAFFTRKLFSSKGVPTAYNGKYWTLIIVFFMSTAGFVLWRSMDLKKYAFMLLLIYIFLIGMYFYRYFKNNLYAVIVINKIRNKKKV